MIINVTSPNEMTGFYVVFKGSTLLEKEGNRGISHLMEHILSKNIEHLEEDFDRNGIVFNAYTSTNEIVFHLKGLDDRVLKYRDEFLKCITEFSITEEDFEKERKIVIEEYSDYFEDKTSSHYMNLFRKIYNDYGAIGCLQDLEALKFSDIKDFYELQYSKPSIIVNVSKNNPFFNDTIEFSDRSLDKKLVELVYNDFIYEDLCSSTDSTKTSIMLTSKVIDRQDVRISKVINKMLSYGLKSPLYQEVREKRGLCYYIGCDSYRVNMDHITYIMTNTSNSNRDEVLNSIKLVLDNPSEYLSQERLELIKDNLMVNRIKSEINLYNNVNKFITPMEFQMNEEVDNITLEDVYRVYDKYYKFDMFRVSTDKDEF